MADESTLHEVDRPLESNEENDPSHQNETLRKQKKVTLMNRITEQLLDNRYQDILDILKVNNDLNIMEIQDKKGFSLIHRMALHQKKNDIIFLVNYVENLLANDSSKKEKIKTWIDSQNEDGLTALHYASFKGDIEVLSYLISLNANLMLRNKNGLTVFHIAAQGDQPISLCYLYSLGFSLYDTENKGGTALHWACYLGCENSVNFLLAKMKCDINLPDNILNLRFSLNSEGLFVYLLFNNDIIIFQTQIIISIVLFYLKTQYPPSFKNKINNEYNQKERLTPLHLAVISGNARIVKKLLLRGADRTARDLNGKTPTNLSEDDEYFNIKNMLEQNGGFQEYCNIKQPFKKIDKNAKQLQVLMLLLFCSQGSILAFFVPCFDKHYVELSVWVLLNVFTIIGLLFSWLTNPGEVNGILQISTQTEKLSDITQEHHEKENIQQFNEQNSFENIPDSNERVQTSVISSTKLDTELVQPLLRRDNESESLKINVRDQREELILKELLRLYKTSGDDSRVCVECCIIKPKRSRHCEICKKCIRVYDHHCPWINNCVGTQNYKYFMIFIIFLWLNMLWNMIIFTLHISSDYGDEEHSNWIFNWYKSDSSQTLQILDIAKYLVSGIVMTMTVFFFVLHSVLCFVQLSNLFLNQTTFERYNTHSNHTPTNKESGNLKISNQSSMDNPSFIQSNSKRLNNQTTPNKVFHNGKLSLKNASLMCFHNSTIPDYDYVPSTFSKASIFLDNPLV